MKPRLPDWLWRVLLFRVTGPDIVLFGTLLIFAAIAVYRANPQTADWRHWREETVQLLRHGRLDDNTAMYGYLPGMPVLLIAVAGWPPNWLGGALLAGSNLASVLLSAWLLRRHILQPTSPPTEPKSEPSPEPSTEPSPEPSTEPSPEPTAESAAPAEFVPLWQRFAAPLLLAAAVQIYDPITANQLSLWILAAVVGGLSLIASGQPLRGGVLLGLATTVKPPAGMMMAFCVWKRQWSAVAGWAVGMMIFELLPAVLFYGPSQALVEHFRWAEAAAARGHSLNFQVPMHFRRNQALSVVLVRWLTALPDTERYVVVRGRPSWWIADRLEREAAVGRITLQQTPLPPEGPLADPFHIMDVDLRKLPRWAVADLSVDTVRLIWLGVSAGLGLALLTVSRRPGSATPTRRWWAEAAVWMVATFWFTPLLYHNYYVWALPAVAVLWSALCDGRPSRQRIIVCVCLALWLGPQLLRGQWWAEFYGWNLLASLPLAVGVLWAEPSSETCRPATGETSDLARSAVREAAAAEPG